MTADSPKPPKGRPRGRRAGASPAWPASALIASGAFGARLTASAVGTAIARGIEAGGMPAPDLCPLDMDARVPAEIRDLLAAAAFEHRMRRARTLIIAAERLSPETIVGSVAWEIATRARQGGVPACAIARESTLDLFGARILDLQVILQAGSARALTAAGRKLADLI